MKKLLMVWLAALLLPALAFATGSTINATIPAANSALQSAPIRANFLAAYNDINGLIEQNASSTAPSGPILGQLWLQTGITPYVLKEWDGTQWVQLGLLNATTHTWIIPPANGGTGITSPGAIGNVLTSTGSGWASQTPTNTGTVTSVNCLFPSIFNYSGCPITTSGTIAVTLANEGQGLVFAGPSSGGSGAPSFRSLVAADVPQLNQNTTGTAGNVTGVVASANGGTGLTTCSTTGYVLTWTGSAWGCLVPTNGGTVTSVALNLPGTIFSVSGSPVTTSGTLTGTLLAEPPNFLWAGPTSGSAAQPAFRGLVANDIPATLNTTTFAAPGVTVGTLGYTDTGILTSLTGNANSYQQVVIQNLNAGATASADLIVSNNLGTATTYYGNFGINSSTFSGSGSLNLPNATYLTGSNGELVFGTLTSNGLHFVVNSGATDALSISSAGLLTATGNVALTGLTTSGTKAAALCADSSGNVISSTSSNCFTSSQVYPGAGIPNSTGSAWGTSYSTSGTGTVVALTNSPTFVTPALGTPSSGVATNLTGTATGLTAGNATTAVNQSGGTVAATTITASSTITPSQTAGIVGTTTNNNANTGSVGEYVTNSVSSGVAISLTSGTPVNVTSISLTAGDWDVTGAVDYILGTTTNVTNFRGSISTTSATQGGQDTGFSDGFAAMVVGSATETYPLPVVRLSLSATTTVYLVSQATFTVSTVTTYGTLRARRVR